jgi:hypothetical protein
VEVGDDDVFLREELVTVSTIEEDTDLETNFLAAMTYHSRSAVAAWSPSRS